MNKSYLFISVVVFLASLLSVNSICNECQENGVACINKTSYQMCFGGKKANFKQTFNCVEGTQCTDLPKICLETGAWAPSCGDVSKCGVCDENRVFACTSRRTYKFCFGSDKPSDVKGFCPVGTVCDSTNKSICVARSETNVEPSCDMMEAEELPKKLSDQIDSNGTVVEKHQNANGTNADTKPHVYNNVNYVYVNMS